MSKKPKNRITVFLKESTTARLVAEAQRREETLSATVDQWLQETLPLPGSDNAQQEADSTKSTTTVSTTVSTLPEPPECPYITHWDDGREVWDAVAAQREKLTPVQFAKKYGRNIHTGAQL